MRAIAWAAAANALTRRTGASGRHLVAVALPSALLLTVAATQMAMAKTTTLSPWKGGGFGMFASTDGLPFRSLRIVVTAPERSETLALPASLDDLADRAVTFPHPAALRALADAVIARERRQARDVSTVRIEVWRADYTRSLAASRVPLAFLTVSADEAGRADAR